MDIVKFIAVAVILIGLFAIRVIRYRSKWRKGGGSHGE
jgi:aryl carrier-like protein